MTISFSYLSPSLGIDLDIEATVTYDSMNQSPPYQAGWYVEDITATSAGESVSLSEVEQEEVAGKAQLIASQRA